MKFGLDDHHWQFILDTLVTPLKKFGVKIWVFGSRATGKHKKFSDLDILIDNQNKSLPQGLLAAITEQLEDSNLPIKIDIVEIQNLASSYKDSVLNDRIEI